MEDQTQRLAALEIQVKALTIRVAELEAAQTLTVEDFFSNVSEAQPAVVITY